MHNEYGKELGSIGPTCIWVGVVSMICSLIAVIMPKIAVTADN
jgi:hypothetical protein